MRRFLIALLCLVVAANALARDVYVSPDGSDANSGTAAAPMRTVDSAFGVMSGGDTLHLAPGKYARIRVPKRLAGTVDRRTNILASDGAEIIGTAPYGVLIEPGANFITIDGLHVARVNGTGIIARECKHYEIRHCVVSDCTESGIDAGSGHVPFDMQGIINGCEAVRNGKTSLHHGIYTSHSNATIRDCVASGNTGYGIHVWDDVDGTRSCLITGCCVFGNKLGAVILSGDSAGRRCHNVVCGNVLSVDSITASSACVQLWRTNGAAVVGNVMFTSWATLSELPGTTNTTMLDNCEYPIGCRWNTHGNAPSGVPVVKSEAFTLVANERRLFHNVLTPGRSYRVSFVAACSAEEKQVRIEYPHRSFAIGVTRTKVRTAFIATKANFSLHSMASGQHVITIDELLVEKAYGPGIEDPVHRVLYQSVGSALGKSDTEEGE